MIKSFLWLLILALSGLMACAPASHVRLGLDIHVPANMPDFSSADSLVIGRPSP